MSQRIYRFVYTFCKRQKKKIFFVTLRFMVVQIPSNAELQCVTLSNNQLSRLTSSVSAVKRRRLQELVSSKRRRERISLRQHCRVAALNERSMRHSRIQASYWAKFICDPQHSLPSHDSDAACCSFFFLLSSFSADFPDKFFSPYRNSSLQAFFSMHGEPVSPFRPCNIRREFSSEMNGNRSGRCRNCSSEEDENKYIHAKNAHPGDPSEKFECLVKDCAYTDELSIARRKSSAQSFLENKSEKTQGNRFRPLLLCDDLSHWKWKSEEGQVPPPYFLIDYFSLLKTSSTPLSTP